MAPAHTSDSISCVYCGIGNPPGRSTCETCKNTLVQSHPAEDQFRNEPGPTGVSEIAMDFNVENGLSYPDWEKIGTAIQQKFESFDFDAVYRELARRWLRQLREDLGGSYRCYESANFFLLGAEGLQPSQKLIEYAEQSLTTISSAIGPLMPYPIYGKRTLLVFNDPDDYYAYISHFYKDGDHALSGGVFISHGYAHIALPFTHVYGMKRVIAHELVHDSIFHLPVPTWLNEGLAQKIDGFVAGSQFVIDAEKAMAHRTHWTPENIQEFWAGTCVYNPDLQKLSYELSLVLVELLSSHKDEFIAFVREADQRDSGQDAAQRILGKCLGDTLAGFLGSGDWRPNRRSIAALWAKANWVTEPEDTEPGKQI